MISGAPMLKQNSYFDGRVQSLGFERQGRALSVGVVEEGTYKFGTGAPERMHVVAGEFLVKRDGEAEFRLYPAGTSFEVGGNSSFEVQTSGPTAYFCEYL